MKCQRCNFASTQTPCLDCVTEMTMPTVRYYLEHVCGSTYRFANVAIKGDEHGVTFLLDCEDKPQRVAYGYNVTYDEAEAAEMFLDLSTWLEVCGPHVPGPEQPEETVGERGVW